MKRRRFGSGSNRTSTDSNGPCDDSDNPLLRSDDVDIPGEGYDEGSLNEAPLQAAVTAHDRGLQHSDDSYQHMEPPHSSEEPVTGCSSSSFRTPPKSEQDADDWSSQLPPEIRCPVCLDAFTAPVTFHCNHNVCKQHILDLAAMSRQNSDSLSGTLNASHQTDLRVPCPKCRKETVFENAGLGGAGEAAIAVNHEMQAIVDMMIKMLKQQSSRQGGGGGGGVSPQSRQEQPDGSTRRPGSSGLPPLGRRSTSRERRQVSFKGEEAHDSTIGSPPQLEGVRRTDSATVSPLNANSSSAEQRAVTKLVQLEKDLARRRDEQRAERERIAKQKADEFKRQRQSWIEEKNRELQQQENSIYGNNPAEFSDAVMTTEFSPVRPASSRMEVLEREQHLHQLQFAQERQHEAEVHKHVQEFLKKEESSSVQHGHGPSAARNSALLPLKDDGDGYYRHQHSGAVALSSSAKAREAESRVMHAYRAPTEEEYRAKKEEERRLREMAEEEARRNAAYVDEEVEKKLWEVEMLVRREHEAELTRAQMAEIAELRARQTLAKFAKAPAQPSPVKATYVPKLNRLQKF